MAKKHEDPSPRKFRGPKRPSLTVHEAAEYSGLTWRQIKRLIERRELPYWKTSHNDQGRIMIDPDDLDRFQEEHTIRVREA